MAGDHQGQAAGQRLPDRFIAGPQGAGQEDGHRSEQEARQRGGEPAAVQQPAAQRFGAVDHPRVDAGKGVISTGRPT
jgi:hypothetical protein